MHSKLLDVVHLKEPIQSRDYLAERLHTVTEAFGITKAIFTITRDNASANTVILRAFKSVAREGDDSLQLPWSFTMKEGDARCMAHIINIAVQNALKMLKTDAEARNPGVNSWLC